MGTRRERKGYMPSDTGNEPTPEEVAAMLSGLRQAPEQEPPSALEIACGGRLMLVQTPAQIELRDGRTFYVTDLQAWGWTPFGVLGVGSFDKQAAESDDNWESRLFAADVVHNVKFDKQRYEAIIEQIKAEEAEAEPTEDEQPASAEDEADYAVAA